MNVYPASNLALYVFCDACCCAWIFVNFGASMGGLVEIFPMCSVQVKALQQFTPCHLYFCVCAAE